MKFSESLEINKIDQFNQVFDQKFHAVASFFVVYLK